MFGGWMDGCLEVRTVLCIAYTIKNAECVVMCKNVEFVVMGIKCRMCVRSDLKMICLISVAWNYNLNNTLDPIPTARTFSTCLTSCLFHLGSKWPLPNRPKIPDCLAVYLWFAYRISFFVIYCKWFCDSLREQISKKKMLLLKNLFHHVYRSKICWWGVFLEFRQ